MNHGSAFNGPSGSVFDAAGDEFDPSLELNYAHFVNGDPMEVVQGMFQPGFDSGPPQFQQFQQFAPQNFHAGQQEGGHGFMMDWQQSPGAAAPWVGSTFSHTPVGSGGPVASPHASAAHILNYQGNGSNNCASNNCGAGCDINTCDFNNCDFDHCDFDHCGFDDCTANCWSQCGEEEHANCCYDAGCSVDMSACCFDEDCVPGGSCADAHCEEATHPCTDRGCTSGSTNTPESATIMTPTTLEAEPVIDSVPIPDNAADASADPQEVPDEQEMAASNKAHIVGMDVDVDADMNAGVDLEADEDETGPFPCFWILPNGVVCNHPSETQEELQTHCREEHTKHMAKAEDGGFRCEWSGCNRDKNFTQKSKLDRHIQTHTGFKPFQCPQCKMRLSAKQAYDQHMRIHTGETPHVCPFEDCDKAFKQASALTMHIRTHTGEKPLACNICGKEFSESSNLSKHMRIHNPKIKYPCELCHMGFTREDQLRRHIGAVHKIIVPPKDGKMSRPKQRRAINRA